jgi:hypothetical protein
MAHTVHKTALEGGGERIDIRFDPGEARILRFGLNGWEVVLSGRAPHPAYLALLRRKAEFTETFKLWRQGFQKCADTFASVIAAAYNAHARMGEFKGWYIDAVRLRDILRSGGVKEFDEATFNRYSGRARGIFRTYRFDSHEEVGSAPLFSYWEPDNFLDYDGRVFKQILGSDNAYYTPETLPDLAERKVDIILNSWRADVGVTSWVDIYQHRRHIRASFAYKLPGQDELLWFVKDIEIDGQKIRNNIFMASHEWKEVLNGRVAYLMIAMFFEADFERCSLKLHEDTFWRVRYEEEKSSHMHQE